MSNKTQKVEQTSSQQLDPRMSAYLFGSDANGAANNNVDKNMPGLFSTAMSLYNQGPAQYYQGNTYAGLNDTQNSAINGATSYLQSPDSLMGATAGKDVGGKMVDAAGNFASMPTLGGVNQSGTGDYMPALNDVLSGTVNNPFLQQTAQAIGDTASRNFAQNVLPQIRSGAQAAGQYGGSRQGIAEGLAMQGLNSDITNAVTNMYGNAYNQAQQNKANAAMQQSALTSQGGLEASRLNQAYDLGLRGIGNNMAVNGVGLLNNASQQPIQNYQTQLGIGGLLQQENQNQINADKARWDYNQNADWQNLNNISGLLTGNATLGASNTGSSQQFYNPTMQWMGAVGGLVNNLNGGGGGGGSADTASKAAGLMGFFSDKRIKKDIQQIGHTSKGFPLYLFRYNWDQANESPRIGVMAQDVEKVMPEAVITRDDGIKTVNYAMVM